jgi:hypothetical protein
MFQHRHNRYLPKVTIVAISLFGLLSPAACGGLGSNRTASAPPDAAGRGSAGPPASAAASALSSAAAGPTATTASTPHAHDYVLTEGPETAGFISGASLDSLPPPQISESTLAACLGIPITDLHDRTIDAAAGPYLTSFNRLTTIGSNAMLVPASEVTRDTAILSRAQTPACFGQMFFPAIKDGLDEVSADSARATLEATYALPPPAGATGMIRMIMMVTGNDTRIPITLDFVVIMSGRVESYIAIAQANSAPAPALEQNITRQVAEKIARQPDDDGT